MRILLFGLCSLHRVYRDSEHVEGHRYAVRSRGQSDLTEMLAMSTNFHSEKASKLVIFAKTPRSQNLIVLKGGGILHFRGERRQEKT